MAAAFAVALPSALISEAEVSAAVPPSLPTLPLPPGLPGGRHRRLRRRWPLPPHWWTWRQWPSGPGRSRCPPHRQHRFRRLGCSDRCLEYFLHRGRTHRSHLPRRLLRQNCWYRSKSPPPPHPSLGYRGRRVPWPFRGRPSGLTVQLTLTSTMRTPEYGGRLCFEEKRLCHHPNGGGSTTVFDTAADQPLRLPSFLMWRV